MKRFFTRLFLFMIIICMIPAASISVFADELPENANVDSSYFSLDSGTYTESFSFTVDRDTAVMRIAPIIITQPQDFTGAVGDSAKFRVKASGDGLNYQWQVSDDQGETWTNSSIRSATYSVKLTKARDGRMLRCIITGSNGASVTSDMAAMRIAPIITTQPQDFTGAVGDSAKFRVKASGDGLNYQWQVSDDQGETWTNSSIRSATYSVRLTNARDGRMLRCIITTSSGASVISDTAIMRIE